MSGIAVRWVAGRGHQRVWFVSDCIYRGGRNRHCRRLAEYFCRGRRADGSAVHLGGQQRRRGHTRTGAAGGKTWRGIAQAGEVVMQSKRLIVMKFGGTSVGDAERFRQCAAIIGKAARHDRIIVVVSAMAGVTDLIFKTIDAARHGDSTSTRTQLQRFESVHRELIASLFEPQQHATANEYIAEVIAQLQNACHALSALRSDISAQTADSLVALGERISAWVLAGYLQQTGSAAEFVRAENVIVTDSNFGNAAPDIDATRKKCEKMLLPLF